MPSHKQPSRPPKPAPADAPAFRGPLVWISIGLALGLLASSFVTQLSTPETDLEPKFDIGKWKMHALEQERMTEARNDITKGHSKFHMMYQTPIFHTNFEAFGFPDFDLAEFNQALAEPIREAFDSLLSENADASLDVGDQGRDINQLFYNYQVQGTGWDKLAQRPAFKKLIGTLQQVVDIFLRNVGVDEDTIQGRSKSIEAWATVHKAGMNHLMHSHPGSIVSAVYYPKIPKGAGKIMFQDPRGALPPFDFNKPISPKEGDIVMFPSWLLHQVLPTLGDDDRISIAFNFEGTWDVTSNVESSFEIPLYAKKP